MNYKVYLSTKIDPKKLKNGSGILVLEPDDYTDTTIKKIKGKGYKVLGYISIGTIEKERSWYRTYKEYGLKKLEDWPNEVYADMKADAWQRFLLSRAEAIKKKGFDGWWCDNLDVYEYYKSEEMFKACKKVLTEIKKLGGYVMVNGGSEFWDVSMDNNVQISGFVNGVTQEEVFSRITSYKGSGKFGTQKAADSKFYKKILQKLLKNSVQTFLLEYTKQEALKKRIKAWCKAEKMTGYYISGNVDL